MIRKVGIENFKSIPKLAVDLARVTVLIGANGSGKSNILEAIALASAAAEDKLDSEFLSSRGIRLTETRFMKSAFGRSPSPSSGITVASGKAASQTSYHVFERDDSVTISFEWDDQIEYKYELFTDEASSFPKWQTSSSPKALEALAADLVTAVEFELSVPGTLDRLRKVVARLKDSTRARNGSTLTGFLIYAPENSSLRSFQAEGQILPLGVKGEGLFAHLKGLDSEIHRDRLEKIREHLRLIDWFETFVSPDDLSPVERSIRIQDRYLSDRALFDQRSANEGFLFLLFYLTLMISPETPPFFAIDNIDSSLNPKICVALVEQIVKLAKHYDKQVILTTHNPAVLDGLDLSDEEQLLLVADRDKEGHTRVRRVEAPRVNSGQSAVSLSDAFMRGYIGGLPKNF